MDGKDSLLFQGLDVQVSIQINKSRGLRNLSIFFATVYVKLWTHAHLAVKAPTEDVNLFKALQHYKSVDETSSKATYQKMSRCLFTCRKIW